MDSRSRTLVREAQARDGDPVAEALVLADRLRRGDLARDRLEVAEVCGSEAARLALGTEATYSPVGFTVLVDGLPDVALLPALIAAAEAALPHVGLTPEAATAAACVLEAARAFSVAPSEAARERWRAVCGDWCREAAPQGWLPMHWFSAVAPSGAAAVVATSVRHFAYLLDHEPLAPDDKRRRLLRCRLFADPAVQPAVERALIAWALA